MASETPNLYRVYKGDGTLSTFKEVRSIDSPEDYVPSKALTDAVNVAILLGKPLLITGEPGTGKTLLADSIAHDLKLDEPLKFVAKTTSMAKDLFYRYDALRHFHDTNREKLLDPEKLVSELKSRHKSAPASDRKSQIQHEYEPYIEFVALGQAIKIASEQKKRSVVLIDEIDKAPRDFPNDMLREIERMEFEVTETGSLYKAEKAYKPIVVITSNSERLLPDAFLRRCVYCHIDFKSLDLKHIVMTRLGEFKEGDELKKLSFSSEQLDWLIKHFEEVRNTCRRKKPATAELLSWIQLLDKYDFDPAQDFSSLSLANRDILQLSYAILAKHIDDLNALQTQIAFQQPTQQAASAPVRK